jgi:hypothetical protein
MGSDGLARVREGGSPPFARRPSPHRERRALAIAILGIVLVLIVTAVVLWLTAWSSHHEDDFIASAHPIPYRQLSAYPARYAGKKMKVRGEIVAKSAFLGETSLVVRASRGALPDEVAARIRRAITIDSLAPSGLGTASPATAKRLRRATLRAMFAQARLLSVSFSGDVQSVEGQEVTIYGVVTGATQREDLPLPAGSVRIDAPIVDAKYVVE